MSASDASRADLGKFCKFFSTRLVQAVVQSRLGQTLSTPCDPSSSDWFNVKMEELGEVTGELRAATQGKYPPDLPDLSLEFELRTAEGELLPLEAWHISFDSEECDPGVGVRAHLYHQLSTLLRSAMAAARLTPLYRYYARRQGPDSFIVCYAICPTRPHTAALGSGFRSIQLGALPSPLGTLRLNLHFRTSMVISDKGEEEEGEEGRETRRSAVKPVQDSGDVCLLRPGSSESESSLFAHFSTSPPSASEAPWPLLAPQRKGSVTFAASDSSASSKSSQANQLEAGPGISKRGSNGALFSLELSGGSGNSKEDVGKEEPCGEEGAAVEEEEEEDDEVGVAEGEDFPFAALLSASSAPQLEKLSLKEEDVEEPSSQLLSPTRGLRPTRITEDSREELEDEAEVDSSDDSFVKVEAAPLFVRQTAELGSDLNVLVREWKTAPTQLPSFSQPLHSPRQSQAPQGLSSQLPAFQGLRGSFDEFVRSLDEAEED